MRVPIHTIYIIPIRIQPKIPKENRQVNPNIDNISFMISNSHIILCFL